MKPFSKQAACSPGDHMRTLNCSVVLVHTSELLRKWVSNQEHCACLQNVPPTNEAMVAHLLG